MAIILILIIGCFIFVLIKNIKKEPSTREKIFTILLILGFIGMLYFPFKKQYELKSNCKFTKGIVKGYEYKRNGKYYLTYTFYVNEKKYTDRTVTQGFNCLKDKDCLGKEFLIAYLHNDPSNSDIYLGKFERHKASVNLFDVNWRDSDLFYQFVY